jgi:hypothetical protein
MAMEKGAHMNFVMVENKLKFEVNLKDKQGWN